MLKYLFTAQYDDGTIYEQTPEDVSVSDPSRSCFFDVDQDRLVAFLLMGEGHTYLVDLRDGHFEVDGVSFHLVEETPSKRTLVFARQHDHDIKVTAGRKPEELSHTIVYLLGWKAGDQEHIIRFN